MKGAGAKRIKVRRLWTINPRTRVKKSTKIYSRPKAKKEIKIVLEEW